MLKGLAGAGFLGAGLVNLTDCLIGRKEKRLFSLLMVLGLGVCLWGDILLNIRFSSGVAVFALGHILYSAAYSALLRPKILDIVPGICLFALILLIASQLRGLFISPPEMKRICIAYAGIICIMAGKAIANFCRNPNRVTFCLMLGSLLFLFSDAMLGMRKFCYWPKVPSYMSRYAYFPGQFLLGHALFWLDHKKEK